MEYLNSKIDELNYSATHRAKNSIADIKELVNNYNNDPSKNTRLKVNECIYCFYGNKWGGSGYTEASCYICKDPMMFSSTYTDKLCKECSIKYKSCRHCGADIELKIRRKSKNKGE